MSNIFGVLAVSVSVIGFAEYLYSAYKKKIKPQRVTWAIFIALSIIGVITQYNLGARASLYYFSWILLVDIIVLAFALRKDGGVGGTSKIDYTSIVLVMLSLGLWWYYNSALIGLLLSVIPTFIAAFLTALKAYKTPSTESLFMWSMGVLSGILSMLAVGKIDFGLLIAPVELVLSCGLIVGSIMIGRRRQERF